MHRLRVGGNNCLCPTDTLMAGTSGLHLAAFPVKGCSRPSTPALASLQRRGRGLFVEPHPAASRRPHVQIARTSLTVREPAPVLRPPSAFPSAAATGFARGGSSGFCGVGPTWLQQTQPLSVRFRSFSTAASQRVTRSFFIRNHVGLVAVPHQMAYVVERSVAGQIRCCTATQFLSL